MFYELTAVVKGFGITVIGISFFVNPIVMGFITSDHVSLVILLVLFL